MPPCPEDIREVLLTGRTPWRVAGEVGDHRMGVLQIEHLEDGVGGLSVLPFYDGVLDAHLLGRHVVFENGLAV